MENNLLLLVHLHNEYQLQKNKTNTRMWPVATLLRGILSSADATKFLIKVLHLLILSIVLHMHAKKGIVFLKCKRNTFTLFCFYANSNSVWLCIGILEKIER